MRKLGLVGVLGLAAASCASPSTAPARAQPLASAAPPAPASARDAGPGPGTAPGGSGPADACAAGELLARHAHAYGSAAAVIAELPRSFRWTATSGVGEARGVPTSTVLEVRRYAHSARLGPSLLVAEGVDEKGAWTTASGAPLRLAADEAIDAVLMAWLLRRGYLAEGAAPSTCTRSQTSDGHARLVLRAARPELGNPELAFDAGSAELVAVDHRISDDGTSVHEDIAWTAPDAAGVRWPFVDRAPADLVAAPGARCFAADAARDATAHATGEACFAPPPTALALTWPAEGRVRVPLKVTGGVVTVRASVGGRDTWVLLDSGGELSVVDPSLAAKGGGGAITVESVAETAVGATRIQAVSLGGLRVSRAPAIVAALPYDGVKVSLGYALFESAAIRVDYAKGEVVLAKDASALVSPGARATPIRAMPWGVLAEAQIEGARASLTVDTGASSTVALHHAWAGAHRFPGSRPVMVSHVTSVATSSAGSLFVAAPLKIGALELAGARAWISPGAAGTSFGEDGTLGDAALAACAAVVFDVAHRKLWIEPPCDRVVPDLRGDFDVVANDEVRDRPWVVSSLLAGGSAARSGMELGDRLLEVGGVAATGDAMSRLAEAMRRPPGTQIPVVVSRYGAKTPLTLTLVGP